eukprot:32100-Eustigmatos_ZCMA.PRE.1
MAAAMACVGQSHAPSVSRMQLLIARRYNMPWIQSTILKASRPQHQPSPEPRQLACAKIT